MVMGLNYCCFGNTAYRTIFDLKRNIYENSPIYVKNWKLNKSQTYKVLYPDTHPVINFSMETYPFNYIPLITLF